MAVLLLVSMILLSKETAGYVMNYQALNKESERIVVLDAGHGGDDPGKVGVNSVLEQDINLAITKRVEALLEANDITVIMTRKDGNGLDEGGSKNKKVQDMKKRLEIIEETKPSLVVSIHQNSYHEESIRGAQVFYYTTSEESRKIAEIMQQQLIERVERENKRAAKANDSYYLLKKTPYPIVIVECGFLSNWTEAELLATEEYQEKVAWAIHMGILQYLNQVGK